MGEQCCFGDVPSSGCHVPGPLHLGDLASPGINVWPLLRDNDLQEQFRRVQRLYVCVFNDQQINHLFKNFAAFGILVPQPGIEPVPSALGAQNLSHWTTREVPGRPFQCKNGASVGGV